MKIGIWIAQQAMVCVKRMRTVVAAKNKRKLTAAAAAAAAAHTATLTVPVLAAADDDEAVPAALQRVGAAPLEARPARVSCTPQRRKQPRVRHHLVRVGLEFGLG